ncbi:MAG: division/cell wall cluster transcriptional repressor MraZ [Deltaproteobacteria bacterium]|nr:division/cell wall cluster transcriptional repressor MraZ [Deltaproteobacteria bacterium]
MTETTPKNVTESDLSIGGSMLGHFEHRFDLKNRITLPSEYRARLEQLGERSVVLTNFLCDGARCLDGYVRGEWVSFERKLRERSRFDPQLRKLETFYLSRAAECPVDSSGRILVPPHLRIYAGLDKEVVFASSLHGFRVWDKRVWDHVFTEAETALLENPGLFRDVDL